MILCLSFSLKVICVKKNCSIFELMDCSFLPKFIFNCFQEIQTQRVLNLLKQVVEQFMCPGLLINFWSKIKYLDFTIGILFLEYTSFLCNFFTFLWNLYKSDILIITYIIQVFFELKASKPVQMVFKLES